jgi:guanylate kinase
LEKRLRNRSRAEGVMSDEVIERRLHEARKEIENYPKYDYSLVNDRLEDSVDQLKAIVLSERARHSGRSLTPEEQHMCETALHCRQSHHATGKKLEEILATFASATAS